MKGKPRNHVRNIEDNSKVNVKKELSHNYANEDQLEPLNLSIRKTEISHQNISVYEDHRRLITSNPGNAEFNNMFHNKITEKSNPSTSSQQSDNELKVYEENNKMHMFELVNSSVDNIYYCECCDKIMKQGKKNHMKIN